MFRENGAMSNPDGSHGCKNFRVPKLPLVLLLSDLHGVLNAATDACPKVLHVFRVLPRSQSSEIPVAWSLLEDPMVHWTPNDLDSFDWCVFGRSCRVGTHHVTHARSWRTH